MTQTKIMTGAELKVRLGALGLPPGWFAARMEVTMRTVVRWFDSDVVSEEVAWHVNVLSDKTLDEMLAMIDKVSDEGDVVLKTYRTDGNVLSKHGQWPASWHRQLTFRVMEHLEAQDRDVTIEYL
jgi:hypothetical protein